MNKVCETGPLVYRPYPRRLESLIICKCHYKGSIFSSVGDSTFSSVVNAHAENKTFFEEILLEREQRAKETWINNPLAKGREYVL